MPLSRVTAFDSETQSTYCIPLKRVTLIGGLINTLKPSVIEFVEQEAKRRNLENEAILAYTQKDPMWLYTQYKNVMKLGRQYMFLSFLQAGDKTIRQIEVCQHSISIYREETSDSLYTASDLIHRLAVMACKAINNKFLIVDEIENGLHYSSYWDLWFKIFETAYLYRTQIVATTHSKEMIEVFARSALAYNHYNSGSLNTAYTEITRSPETGNLIAIQRDANAVLDALEDNKEIRGDNS